MVALLITPPTAARFWTDNFARMTLVAAAIGGASAAVGCLLSAIVPKLAGGPTIVLSGTAFFVLSMLFGTRRGIVQRWLRHAANRRRIGRDDLLRAMYEIIEARLVSANDQSVTENGLYISPSLSGSEATEEESAMFAEQAVQISELFNHRSWSARHVNWQAQARRNPIWTETPA